MSGAANIIYEFDSETRILHLSAEERIVIKSEAKLTELCHRVREIIEQNAGGEPIYMVVDLKKFHIDPSLADSYGRKITGIYRDHIYPGGLVRYGLEITRVTIKVGQPRHMNEDPLLFVSKKDAMLYLNSLIANNRASAQNNQPST
jgi:hypothetical protein